MANDPSTVSGAVSGMRVAWDIVDTLMGGTTAMRNAGKAYLPKWPKEDDDSYRFRLKNSTLLPAFSETVANMTGRVFAEPIILKNDVPGSIVELCEDIDSQGNNLQAWAAWLFTEGLSHGMAFALVEFPRTIDENGKQIYRTRADEISANIRPYVVSIKCKQVLGWQVDAVNGKPQLTQFRYAESVTEKDPKNEFGSVTIEQIRVLVPGGWSVYRKTGENGEWAIHKQGTNSLRYIPVAIFYTKRTGFMESSPPLMELAHLNVKHWQSQSDQDNITHVARVPLLVSIGVSDSVDQETGKAVPWEMTVGSSAAVRIDNPDGELKYVEHSGAAIQAGRDSLSDLKDEMRMAGAKLLQKEAARQTKTATQAGEEAAQENSPLQKMAGLMQDCITQILQFFADYNNEKSGGTCLVRGNFDIDYAPEVNLPILKSMADAGYISKQTLFEEITRRNVLESSRTWEDETEKIASEGPALGGL